jgi:hypothetical protein
MLKINTLILVSILFIFASRDVKAQQRTKSNPTAVISLAGNWRFQSDPDYEGVTKKWYSLKLPGSVVLPGSMATNHLGDDITLHTPWTGSILDSGYFFKPAYAKYREPGKIKVPFWLQPEKYYKGAAWYQKTVIIPASWKGRHLQLFLERAHWETSVWIDGKSAGTQNSLGAAHIYDLGPLPAGPHEISIRVDNAVRGLDVGENSHSISDHTQTNWNGLVGQLYLKPLPGLAFSDIQLYPDVKNKQVTVEITLAGQGGNYRNAQIALHARSNTANSISPNAVIKLVRPGSGGSVIKLVYPMGNSPLLWSEVSPNLYSMNVSLSTGGKAIDQKRVTFGMRDFTVNGTNFMINGHLTMLRGTLECAVFPKTGYPPTDLASWLKELKKCRDFGLNHIRFHSWCPPEAAFAAADQLGLYLQVECSSWAGWSVTIGDGKPLDKFLYEESRNMIKAYGNHPSFVMMAYGNEPSGDHQKDYLSNFVKYWQERDSRRLYTTGAGWPVMAVSNYNNTADPRIQHGGPVLKNVINGKKPSSDYDWSKIISRWKQPTVSHEIGQWCVYPDFDEISQYTGILKPRNFEIFRDTLERNGLGSLARDFLYASGKLQVLCYKAEVEAALRTKGFGGFQLLSLSDFPGQGTALVGVLNAFWEDKPYTNSAQFSEFCNRVVPLARLPKMIYNNNEVLEVPVEVAQYSEMTLKQVTPSWTISDDSGKVLFGGDLSRQDIPVGNAITLGSIRAPLSAVTGPAHLMLTVHIGRYKNSWDIFVYPKENPGTGPDVLVTRALDAKALAVLDKGGSVLLTLKKGSLKKEYGGDIKIGFSSIFWNTAWTHGEPPFSLGILCDPMHPALKEFPTQKYSNWQWWDAMSNSNAVSLDSVAKGLKPIVRVIDDWVTARSLGLVFECRSGKGKLIISGIDLLSDADQRPEARQLLYSLKKYMESPRFNPEQSVGIDRLKSLTN